MVTEEVFREELAKTLRDDPNNYSLILELSSQLASFDKSNVRFSVDAGVIDRLGRELVARQETAVSELVKNAYDADAKVVELTFENSDEAGGVLTIDDDGVGMTKDELIRGFMRISSTSKIHEPLSPLYGRKRAGRKGVGRFAVQRLGHQLSIITQTENEPEALQININWDLYEGDSNLISIANKIVPLAKTKESGTTLKISNLRDKWTESSIKRVYRYVSAIIQPFPLSKEQYSFEKKRLDPGFKVSFLKKNHDHISPIANEETMIFKYAVGKIEGYVDSEGFGRYHVESEVLNVFRDEAIGLDNNKLTPFKYLRNVHFQAYYFIYIPEFVPKQQVSKLRELSEEIGGIRLYRNGFRVLPYGEPYFDWLNLDRSVRRRSILPQHGNNNFFGFVEVSDETTGLLEETSSREGLQENEALTELQNFVYRSLVGGVTEIARARGVKETTVQKDWEKKYERPKLTVVEVANKVAEEVEQIEDEIREIDQYSDKSVKEVSDIISQRQGRVSRLKELTKDLKEVAEEQSKNENKILEELAMLRVLASLGIIIGEFTHEIRHYLHTLEASLILLKDDLDQCNKVTARFDTILKNVTILRTYASYFDEAISENVVRELVPQEITDVVNTFVEVIRPDVEKLSIDVSVPEYDDPDLYTISMHPSEWSSILFNLYSNAKKAIGRKGAKGRIEIRLGRIDHKIFLEFSDNGDGIPEEFQDKIFDAFFTTSSPVGHFSNEIDEATGTGLGLKIVFDIISAYKGNIELVSPSEGFNTCFRIEIPEASEEEIEKL
ncbi:ATP-binding protein [Pontibacter sp. MBLB2868]|uniref:sensor histidine kinase n=1 Tax=Pontibacter sp. MBLB2868 TaxID=3451555 RepID=UPI003F75418A